ncbi:hypothetical protein SNE35_09405 [Paucibacter sp. R3-3]|uniref:Right handed beta helix domain-containing protein n=1 Tax=Roseateles agri TaxID=3098619 RepID=A0ABU5DEK9_9BURK|nr:hypothetical protein [Paucibacter sp. R3-3]MDY0744724.1 hypothetical protein [Paucibacter sp. R3-3]
MPAEMNDFSYRVRRRTLLSMAGLGLGLDSVAAETRTLRVGPAQAVKTLAEAARVARDGTRIEVDAGDYIADVATWRQNDLSLRAVGGRVRLIAGGTSSQGKGIFVTAGERMRIEGFDFFGCRVPDGNGAGIRLEQGSLSLYDCAFKDNENGLLSGNDGKARLEIENCDFGTIVRQQGQTHNLYVGRIAYLKVTGSYFHDGRMGHLLKSRAAVNHIFYNRLTDEIGGESSYELEFPNGGQCLVVGNLIQQSSTTQNPCIVSFGAEGYAAGSPQELHMVNNTIVDLLPRGGTYLRVAPMPGGRVHLVNNLLAGNPYFAASSEWEQQGNHVVDWDAFVLAVRGDYRLRPNSPLRGKAVDPGEADGLSLRQVRQYRHPHTTVALAGPATDPGAIQQA